MSIVLVGSTSGSCTLQEQAVAGTTVLTLPTTSGTVLTSASSVARSQLPAGSVLQVASSIKTDTFSTTSASFVDITGLSVSITPTSATSRILVMYSVMTGPSTTAFTMLRLVRNSNAIAIGDLAGSRTRITTSAWASGSNNVNDIQNMTFLDSPATTSSVTYQIQIFTENGTTQVINRNVRDDNASYEPRGVSTITVMEIAA